MPERSHDLPDDGFHEVQLSGKQLLFLSMTGAAVIVFIFLLGVMVGRGARDVRLAESVSAASVTLPGEVALPATESGPPAAEPPAPAESPDELSYHTRLQGSETAGDALKKPEPTREPSAPQPSASAPAAPPAATKPAPATAPAGVPTSGRPGTHLIQVFVSRDRNAAVALVKKLGGSGYPAFLVLPESPTVPQMYKVQVGRYSEREADQVARKIEKEGDFKPWVISSR